MAKNKGQLEVQRRFQRRAQPQRFPPAPPGGAGGMKRRGTRWVKAKNGGKS